MQYWCILIQNIQFSSDELKEASVFELLCSLCSWPFEHVIVVVSADALNLR